MESYRQRFVIILPCEIRPMICTYSDAFYFFLHLDPSFMHKSAPQFRRTGKSNILTFESHTKKYHLTSCNLCTFVLKLLNITLRQQTLNIKMLFSFVFFSRFGDIVRKISKRIPNSTFTRNKYGQRSSSENKIKNFLL